MRPIELFLRQQADTAREQQKIERRQDNIKEARREISIYISQGMDREIAVNFVLNDIEISIVDKKEIRKSLRYGCNTIYSMIESISGINMQNNSQILIETI
jgi:hypothetical protein